jgi:hypothetical protein
LKMILLGHDTTKDIGAILRAWAYDFMEKFSYSPDFLMDKLRSDRPLK